MNGDEKIIIFVATHVAFQPPRNPIYVPLHVGRYGKKDLGYIGDDTGNHISDLNYLYGELTGLFWIWQNISGLDYIGLNHYRRFFINDKHTFMDREQYLEILQNCDAIVPKHMQCEGGLNYYEHFAQAHNRKDLDAVRRALIRVYPEYEECFDCAMSGDIYYWGNLMVTCAEIMKRYAEWLFTIFAEASEEIDVSKYDDYHKRVYGFLSEQMFYVYALKNELKLTEIPVGVSSVKAETQTIIEEIKELMKNGKLSEARETLKTQLKNRPDLLLPGSDLNSELEEICKNLKIF